MFTPERHRCFVCGVWFDPFQAELCPECGWLIHNGHCACNLSNETKKAIEFLFETYCRNCYWRLGIWFCDPTLRHLMRGTILESPGGKKKKPIPGAVIILRRAE